MQSILKKRKRKILMLEERPVTIYEIEEKIKKIFKWHIGQGNSINSHDLFVKVFEISPKSVDLYQRLFFWNLIKRVLSHMRSENYLFVVCRGNEWFVLQLENELSFVKRKADAHIKGLNSIKSNGEIWVKEQKWRSLLT